MTITDKNNLIESIPCIVEIRRWGDDKFTPVVCDKHSDKFITTKSGKLYYKDIAEFRNLQKA